MTGSSALITFAFAASTVLLAALFASARLAIVDTYWSQIDDRWRRRQRLWQAASLPLDRIVEAKDYALAEMKWQSDVGMALVFLFVGVFLARNPVIKGDHDHR